MAEHLGTLLEEKDQSKTVSALDVPKGAIGVYAVKGRTDVAVLCRSENDIKRNFGQPVVSQLLSTGVVDLNRGLQNAYAFVRAGKPMFIKRAIPTTVAGVAATVIVNTDDPTTDTAGTVSHQVLATALGHGKKYNGDSTNLGYSLYIGGIESVSRQVTISNGTTPANIQTLAENMLRRSVRIQKIVTGALSGSQENDSAVKRGDATINFFSGNITLTYENASYSNYATLTNTTGSPITVQLLYERTTQQKICKLFLCAYGEADPKNNYVESYQVSFRDDGVDEAGKGCFVEDVVNATSEVFKIDVGSDYITSNPNILATLPTLVDIKQFGAAVAGTDGTYALTDTDISTAYDEFLKKSLYDILHVFDAGYAGIVKAKIARVCAARQFPHGYIDPPQSYFLTGTNKAKTNLVDSLTADLLVKWRMNSDTAPGSGEPLPIAGNDGEFVSVAGSTWGLITDEFNGGRKLLMPPTYEVGKNAIIVDSTLGPWNSVMGPRRGITGFEKLVINLYDYRDVLNVKQVNPLIVDERGIQMYYGNKTLKSVASAMQQSHARKTRGALSREYYFATLDYIAEGIVDTTFNDLRNEFEIITNKYLPGLESFSLVVGPPKTTIADINNQVLRIGVGLIFKQIAEEIVITTTVFRNGTDLSVEIT